MSGNVSLLSHLLFISISISSSIIMLCFVSCIWCIYRNGCDLSYAGYVYVLILFLPSLALYLSVLFVLISACQTFTILPPLFIFLLSVAYVSVLSKYQKCKLLYIRLEEYK